jgi:translation initiation factor IF-1
MPSRDHIEVKGTVTEVLKHGAYRVELANGHRCIARASGEVRLNFIKFTPGDKVSLEFHPYDLSRGRITG